ncbi:hypothetical protein AMECASPLE_002221, partial [Ameca splendens]
MTFSTFVSFCFPKATQNISSASPSDDAMAESLGNVRISHQKSRKSVRLTMKPWAESTMFCPQVCCSQSTKPTVDIIHISSGENYLNLTAVVDGEMEHPSSNVT